MAPPNEYSHRQSSQARTGTRSNQQWVDEITGVRGSETQSRAIDDLSRYLHVVAFNALLSRQIHFSRLRAMAPSDVSELARDFVQDTLMKLTTDNFVRLNQFRGTGKFTSWAAQIIHNEIISELRKVDWDRMDPLTTEGAGTPHNHKELSPEILVLQRYQTDQLYRMIELLPPKLRNAIIRCTLQEEKAAAVAADLGISTTAVYMLVYRAKRQLQQMMACDVEHGLA